VIVGLLLGALRIPSGTGIRKPPEGGLGGVGVNYEALNTVYTKKHLGAKGVYPHWSAIASAIP
jgi:hypothetical protein